MTETGASTEPEWCFQNKFLQQSTLQLQFSSLVVEWKLDGGWDMSVGGGGVCSYTIIVGTIWAPDNSTAQNDTSEFPTTSVFPDSDSEPLWSVAVERK